MLELLLRGRIWIKLKARRFNDGQDTEKVNNTENILPNRIEISDEDIDIGLRQILNQQIENLLKEQGYELSEAKNSVFLEYDIGCTINYK